MRDRNYRLAVSLRLLQISSMVRDELFEIIFLLKMIHWENERKEKSLDSKYYPPITVRVTGISYYS